MDVIVPLPIAGVFTYSIPPDFIHKVQEGCRVIVPFGVKKYYTGIVIKVHDAPPQNCVIKGITDVLDDGPIVLGSQYHLWRWIADYYLCTLGDVYKAALPSGLKMESETLISINSEYDFGLAFSDDEIRVINELRKSEQTIMQLSKTRCVKRLLPVMKSLLDKGAIYVKESLKSTYKPRCEVFVKFSERMKDEEIVRLQLDALNRAPKQQHLMMKYIELSGWSPMHFAEKEVSRKVLIEKSNTNYSILNELVRKGICELYEKEVGRLTDTNVSATPLSVLSDMQMKAYQEIMAVFREKNICLLHGVTASGKTEIYMHLIDKVLKSGKQVLYLLPEISLTTQLTERLKLVFGSRLGIYHSKFSDSERVEIWKKQLAQDCFDIILGVRSSVFLPFRRLGLVIIDEEHETSYKQQDPAPRYHARDVAIMLASMVNAKVLLGTATPSIETYYNATHGKYGLVQLAARYRNVCLPFIELVNIRELIRKKRMVAQFSPLLVQRMRNALEAKEQIILFQNRRGFAPMVECRICGWVPKCKNCDVSLTYHKKSNCLSCHYCGYLEAMPHECPACGSQDLVHRGFGTEKIEDEIKVLFPNARVVRMDLDTIRTRAAYEKAITDFEKRDANVLIGTQMISKGLNFDYVSVVGILNADSMLNYPDFRSYERAFQLMAQVAGRSGRKNKRGLVVLQTKSPELSLIHQVIANDYLGFYTEQLKERLLFKYPPFCRLIYVYLKHRKEEILDEAATFMATLLKNGLSGRVLGPDYPPVSRIQTYYIKKIILKIEKQLSMEKVKMFLLQVQQNTLLNERFHSLVVYYDVDPM